MDVIYRTVDEVKNVRSNSRGKGYGENDGAVTNRKQYEQGIGFPRPEASGNSAGYDGYVDGTGDGFGMSDGFGNSYGRGIGDSGGTSDGFGNFSRMAHGWR